MTPPSQEGRDEIGLNLYHRDTEGTENQPQTMFVNEFRPVSVISVPLW